MGASPNEGTATRAPMPGGNRHPGKRHPESRRPTGRAPRARSSMRPGQGAGRRRAPRPPGRASAGRPRAPRPRPARRRQRIGILTPGRRAARSRRRRPSPWRPPRSRSSSSPTRADHRGRQDRPVGRLVVEADVARHDRDLECAAGVGDPVDRPCQLPRPQHRCSGDPKFRQSVMPMGLAPLHGDVECALDHRRSAGEMRVERPDPRRPGAVDRQRDGPLRCPSPAAPPSHRARSDDGVRPVHVVVPPPDRLAVPGIRGAEHIEQVIDRRRRTRGRRARGRQRPRTGRRGRRTWARRRPVSGRPPRTPARHRRGSG